MNLALPIHGALQTDSTKDTTLYQSVVIWIYLLPKCPNAKDCFCSLVESVSIPIIIIKHMA